MRRNLFVSYSHKDKQYREELEDFLYPLKNRIKLHIWDDTQIEPGDDWENKIQQAIQDSIGCILLVSYRFLASKYIAEFELPVILELLENDQYKIFIVCVSHSLYKESVLSKYQPINNPEKPLNVIRKPKRGEVWLNLADRIMKLDAAMTAQEEKELNEELSVGEKALIEAIKNRYKNLSVSDVDRLALLLVQGLVDGLAEGMTPVFTDMDDEGIHSITSFFIDKDMLRDE